MELAPMDWAQRMKPSEIERGVRAALVMMLHRMRSPSKC